MPFRNLVIVAALLAGVSVVGAQSTDPALTAAFAARDQASIARDVAGLAKYTADDYVAVDPNGVLNTKQQRLDGLKRPANPTAKPQTPLRTEAVHMYGDAAAVVRAKNADIRQLAVWIRHSQGWQLTVIHVVPDTFAPPQAPAASVKAAGSSAVVAPAGLSGDRAAVFAAYKQIQDAVWSGDRATYQKLTAPEFVRLSPGLVRFAGENQAAAGGPREAPTHSDISVSVWGNLGVVRWREKNAAGAEQWLTRVMARKPSGWQQVATASSTAGQP